MKNSDTTLQEPNFPLYRRRPDGKTYYCIISGTEFEELKIFGKKYTIMHIKAYQFPEKLYISELIQASEALERLEQYQYSEMLDFCRSNFEKI